MGCYQCSLYASSWTVQYAFWFSVIDIMSIMVTPLKYCKINSPCKLRISLAICPLEDAEQSHFTPPSNNNNKKTQTSKQTNQKYPGTRERRFDSAAAPWKQLGSFIEWGFKLWNLIARQTAIKLLPPPSHICSEHITSRTWYAALSTNL